MTTEEAIEILENGGWWELLIPVSTIEGRIEYDKLHEAIDLAIDALRPVTREQVERVWCSEWECDGNDCTCKHCGSVNDYDENFCPVCGMAMNNEAVDMVMERAGAIYETD